MTQYYVQDSRQFVGNCILWWRKENAGYTTDINDAAIFEDADLPRNRDSDVPWPKAYIDQHLRKTVDFQNVDLADARDCQGPTE